MASVAHNKDGSAIITLSEPITVKGQELTRVTIPAPRGKTLRLSPFVLGEQPTVGQLIEYAARVVQPEGAVDEMSTEDAMLCGNELANMLGKSRKTGGDSSDSSGAGTDGAEKSS